MEIELPLLDAANKEEPLEHAKTNTAFQAAEEALPEPYTIVTISSLGAREDEDAITTLGVEELVQTDAPADVHDAIDGGDSVCRKLTNLILCRKCKKPSPKRNARALAAMAQTGGLASELTSEELDKHVDYELEELGSTANMLPKHFHCVTCKKIPPPLSPALSNTTRPFVICSKNHITCQACFVRQKGIECNKCENREVLTHLDPFLQPCWLKELYRDIVKDTEFECGRQCGQKFKGGAALLEHEELCAHDPPCVCPLCNKYTFQWPKTDEEKKKILREHGNHIRFEEPDSTLRLFVEQIFDEKKGKSFSQERCFVFQPKYDYYDRRSDLKDTDTLRKVDRYCKTYPYLALWVECNHKDQESLQGNPASYFIRAKWLQINSRIIPDASYVAEVRLTNFHTFTRPAHITTEINLAKSTARLREYKYSHFDPSTIKDLFEGKFRHCSICRSVRKHFHVSLYIYNKAVSVCATRFTI